MTGLYELKERLKLFYGNYSAYITPMIKFVVALAVFININNMLGFMPFLNNVFVVLILALLCSILPTNIIAVFGSFMIMGHCYAVGLDVAAFALILLLFLFLLFVRFTPKEGIMLVVTPLAMSLNIPAAVPVGLGLMRSGGSSASAACGLVLYFFMKLVQDKAATLESDEISAITERLSELLNGMIQKPELWLTVVVFVAVALLVYCLRRASFDFSRIIALVSGCVIYPILMALGSLLLDLDVNLILLIVGSLISLLLMLILNFFIFSVDYSRSEFIQYEDDEYYYYVKAIPKIRVSTPERSVKTIQEDKPEMKMEAEEEAERK